MSPRRGLVSETRGSASKYKTVEGSGKMSGLEIFALPDLSGRREEAALQVADREVFG